MSKFNTKPQDIERVEFSHKYNTYTSTDTANLKISGLQKDQFANQGRAQMLTKELLDLKNSFLSVHNSNEIKKMLLTKLIEKAKERRQYLLNLMDINPVEVVEVSISAVELKSFPIALIPFLEKKISFTGFFQDEEDQVTKTSKHFIKTAAEELIEIKLVDKNIIADEKKEIKVTGIYLNQIDSLNSSPKGKMVVTSSQKTDSQ